MTIRKIASTVASLIILTLTASCAVNKPQVPYKPLIYKSSDYALYKVEKKESFAHIAKICLDSEKLAWKVKDANNLNALKKGSLVIVPLKEKNKGGLFENGYQSVPILCYHKFGPKRNSPLTMPSDIFDKQMKFLKDNGYRTITPAQLLCFLKYRCEIPRKAVMITIDDGYKSVYDIAWPILKKYNFTATLFIYINYVGISRKALSWDNLRELKAHGFTIGSHTVSHPDLTEKKPDETTGEFHNRIKKELLLSKKIIDKKLGQDTIALAFPYGRYNKTVLKISESIGYKIAVTVDRGSNPFFTNSLALKRDMILRKDMKHFVSRLKIFNNVSLR